MACTPIKAKSLEWCEGQSSVAGIKRRMYFTPASSIVTWPTLPATFTTAMGELATLKGNFVLAETTKWQHMDIIVSKSPVSSEPQGSKPNKTFLDKATIVIPHTNADAAGFARLANNSNFVYLVETNNGDYRVIGSDVFDTETSVSTALGGAVTDDMGTTLEISCTNLAPAPFYTGPIDAEEGIINPASPA